MSEAVDKAIKDKAQEALKTSYVVFDESAEKAYVPFLEEDSLSFVKQYMSSNKLLFDAAACDNETGVHYIRFSTGAEADALFKNLHGGEYLHDAVSEIDFSVVKETMQAAKSCIDSGLCVDKPKGEGRY